MSFHDGYETEVGERGVTLSGGQRQRIAIARAFLTDPRILILDDSTSAIDSATEDQIQRAMRRISSQRTTFLITHRLSQIRWADRILVLRRGRAGGPGHARGAAGRAVAGLPPHLCTLRVGARWASFWTASTPRHTTATTATASCCAGCWAISRPHWKRMAARRGRDHAQLGRGQRRADPDRQRHRPGRARPIHAAMLLLAGGVLLLGVAAWVFNFIQQWFSARVVGDVVLKIREDVFAATIRHDLSFYDEHPSGKIVSRITSDTQDLSDVVTLTTNLLSQVLLVRVPDGLAGAHQRRG